MTETPPPSLQLDDRTALLVLTGAGVSAESGLPTYRGTGGLWRSLPFERLASPEGFAGDPALVWRFYSERRETALRAEPNAGHRALVEAERRLGDRFLLVTQNVDGLHRRAGSERLIEIHGRLLGTRCSRCDREEVPDTTAYREGHVPRCDRCRGMLRPAVAGGAVALPGRGNVGSGVAGGWAGRRRPPAWCRDLAGQRRAGRQRRPLRARLRGPERHASSAPAGVKSSPPTDPPTDRSQKVSNTSSDSFGGDPDSGRGADGEVGRRGE